jgi:hypothetical protein
LGHPEDDDADELDDAKSLLRIGEEFTGGPGRTARLVGIGIRGVKGPSMCKITYKVVKHDGGWAYEVNGTYSEPFPRAAALKAAKLAASEQAAPGVTTRISYEDEKGSWHNEVDSGTDRAKTTVQG